MDITSAIGKLLIIAGVLCTIAGIIVVFAGKRLFQNGIPGSITYSNSSFTISFPILACIVASIVLTAVLALFNRQ